MKRIIRIIVRGTKALFQGDLVSSKFFATHFFGTAIIVMSCILVIAQRFDCVTSQNTINRLERQINVMSTEKQKERSRYMTLTRESAMLHLVDSLRLGLTIPDRRPEIISPVNTASHGNE